jgi:hypothetical protein
MDNTKVIFLQFLILQPKTLYTELVSGLLPNSLLVNSHCGFTGIGLGISPVICKI